MLDLSRVLAGPLCTMVLGDMGADVVKVERPNGGDDTRGWGPPFDRSGQSAYFLSVNRNKLSLTADLGRSDDLELVRHLTGEADVVVENFLPGALERRGWGADAALAERPELVWCSIAGFADEPQRPGYDVVVQAEEGWMSITGAPNGEPMKHGIALVDVLAGRDAAIAILGALVARASTGTGRRVTVALDTTARAALVNVAQNALVSGLPPERWGNAHANLVPYQLFHAQDRPLILAVGNDAQWRHCTNVLELPGLAEDPSLDTNAGRLAARERIVPEIGRRFATRPAAHWIERLAAAGVPCGLVRTVPEVLEESGASANAGMPPSVPGRIRLPPPGLGEHTALIRDHGWSAFRMLEDSTR